MYPTMSETEKAFWSMGYQDGVTDKPRAEGRFHSNASIAAYNHGFKAGNDRRPGVLLTQGELFDE